MYPRLALEGKTLRFVEHVNPMDTLKFIHRYCYLCSACFNGCTAMQSKNFVTSAKYESDEPFYYIENGRKEPRECLKLFLDQQEP